jgi:hypothetical protein
MYENDFRVADASQLEAEKLIKISIFPRFQSYLKKFD